MAATGIRDGAWRGGVGASNRQLLGALAIAGSLAPAAALAWHGNPILQGGAGHGTPVRPPDVAPVQPPPDAHLTYFGGPVISNVEVVLVLWGAGTYQSFVEQTAAPSLASFYGAITASPYLDWLTEYDTGVAPVGGGMGTRQTIGRGTFLSQLSIAPSAANDGATVDDANIQTELAAQVAAGQLPPPTVDAAGNVNTVYMIHFPRGRTITQGGTRSCASGGFCAYHNTTRGAGFDLYYAVLPDMSAGTGCDRGCGRSAVPFENQTAVASHELVEAITDPAVGLAKGFGPPLAWYDRANNAEIADLCAGVQGRVVGGDGLTYTVQREWSNAEGDCIVVGAVGDDFSIAVAPATRSLAPGESAVFTVSTAVTRGARQDVGLSLSGLNDTVSATLDPTSVTAGGEATLVVSASGAAPSQTASFTVTGTAASGSRAASASVTVIAGVSVAPGAATVPPGAGLDFDASGGSGDYRWSLETNGSGASIDSVTGAYRAGSTGDAFDVVRATDSLGNFGTARVEVTASAPSHQGCGSGGNGVASLLALASWLWARRSRARRPARRTTRAWRR